MYPSQVLPSALTLVAAHWTVNVLSPISQGAWARWTDEGKQLSRCRGLMPLRILQHSCRLV